MNRPGAPIDLRSDICATPTDAMWDAMRSARLGWATYGEDASVNLLEARVAGLLGKEAAVWVPTCGMANLVAVLALAERGRSVVLEATCHVLTSEGMWISEIAGLVPRSIWAPDGRLDPAAVGAAVREERAAVLCLENTHTRAGGTVLSPDLTRDLVVAARRNGARVHLDGARLANAAIALDVPLRDLAAGVDTVAFGLNKGLCAPMGTVLAGSAVAVGDARMHLARLGGGTVHKAGIAAAAGLVALDEMLGRLVDDHRRARELAVLVSQIPELQLRPEQIETNIVFVDTSGTGRSPDELLGQLAKRGVLGLATDASRVRFVTHRLIGDADVVRAVEQLALAVAEHGQLV